MRYKTGTVIAALTMFAMVEGASGQKEAEPQRAVEAAPNHEPFGDHNARWKVVNLEFPGGTLREFLHQLQQVAGPDVNILISGPAEKILLHEMTLRKVEVETALKVATTGRSHRTADTAYNVRLRDFAPAVGGNVVFAVDVEEVRSRGSGSSAQASRITEVFSLRELLMSGMRAETILTAVEAAIEMSSEGDEEAAIRFHEDSGVLLIRGTSEQIRAVHRMMAELRRSAVLGAAADRELKLRDEEERLRAELGRLYAQRDKQKLELYKARGALSGRVDSAEDAARLSASAVRLELGLEPQEREIQRLETVLTEIAVERHTGRAARGASQGASNSGAPRPAEQGDGAKAGESTTPGR